GLALWCCLLGSAAGLTGALATKPTTLAALALCLAAGLGAAIGGARTDGRVIGWITASLGAMLLVIASAIGTELPGAYTVAGVMTVALLLLLAAAALPAGQQAELRTTEGLSWFAAGVAGLLASQESLWVLASCLVVYGAALGFSALRPGRRWFAAVASGCELIAWWLLLAASEVGLVEAYTLPVALITLTGGALVLRGRPETSSWSAYGPALAATFLPTVALILAGSAHPARRLLLGAGALAVLLLGAVRRRQAPVVCCGGVIAFVAVFELVRYWDLLPRFLPMAVGGLVLVLVGATYEHRRRDLRRLRDVIGSLR
ncbi:MAG: hypothetical protein JXA67_10355, partial [Micromonosporaceae bacterium]|nr:hypothetical protein [Micromonosporaceae bacterium]